MSLASVSFFLFMNGDNPLSFFFAALVLLLTLIFTLKRLYPIRWMAPGLVLLAIFFLYPAINTAVISSTNFGAQHLLSKEQVLQQIKLITTDKENIDTYSWSVYRSQVGDFGILLLGEKEIKWAQPISLPKMAFKLPEVGETSPKQMLNFVLLSEDEKISNLQEISQKNFLTNEGRIVFLNSLSEAKIEDLAYKYNLELDQFTTTESGKIFLPISGVYTAIDGDEILPGYKTGVGFRNFLSIIRDPLVSAPFWRIFKWNIFFAGFSTLIAFGLGFMVALIINQGGVVLKRYYKIGYLMPYILPIFITAPVWVGLLNPAYGPINTILFHVFGIQPDWFSNIMLSKIVLLIISLWLGFPFAMLVCLGALQSVPKELHEAVAVDGGSRQTAVRFITVPWVLSSVAPIVVGAFAFNFNSFALIELVTKGGPPDLSSSSPAGFTDILLSYTYRLAFTHGAGLNYGLAAAISLLIFFITASLSIINFKLANRVRIHEV